MAEISVVIPSVGLAPVDRAVASVVDSVTEAGVKAEIIVMWQAVREPELIPGAKVVPIYTVNSSYARNRGADEASAPLIAYADDDEVVDPGWIGAAMRALDDADAAFGPVDPLDRDGRPHCAVDRGVDRVFEGYVPPWLVGTGGSMAFRKEALAATGAFDLRLGAGAEGLSAEETDLIWRLLRAGRRIRWAPDMVVYHPTKTDEEILASRYPYGFGTGRLLRRARSPRLIANSGHAVLHANMTALRSGDRWQRREAAAFGRGVFEGLTRRVRWLAPELALQPVPSAVATALEGRMAQPLPVPWQARPHFIWTCGDAILHAFIGPADGQLNAPVERERIRALPGVTRIPSVLAHGRSQDALWVLEERVEGGHPDLRRPERWWANAADWIRSYASHPGIPYGESEEWRLDAEDWLRQAPDGLGDAVSAALQRAAARPSGPSHNDLQPKNLVLSPAGVTAIDWEWASTEGQRGGDLLLLATTHGGVMPDENVIRAIAEERNPHFGDVLGPLRDVGLEGQALKDTLLVLLLRWARAERNRHRQLGGSPQAPTYGPMLHRLAPLLT
jgi:hypothetical protein